MNAVGAVTYVAFGLGDVLLRELGRFVAGEVVEDAHVFSFEKVTHHLHLAVFLELLQLLVRQFLY